MCRNSLQKQCELAALTNYVMCVQNPQMPWNHKKTSTSLQLACLHLNINIYQRLIAVCFVLIHLHLFCLCFGTDSCQNNVETIDRCKWGLSLVAQSSCFRWIKLRSCFFFLWEKRIRGYSWGCAYVRSGNAACWRRTFWSENPPVVSFPPFLTLQKPSKHPASPSLE